MVPHIYKCNNDILNGLILCLLFRVIQSFKRQLLKYIKAPKHSFKLAHVKSRTFMINKIKGFALMYKEY